MSEGILTGANRVFWPTLRALVTACREANVSVAVADHGLESWQRRFLAEQGVRVLVGPFAYPLDLYATAHHHASNVMSAIEAWWKPLVCLATPFDRTVWIDADAVPVRDVPELFALLDAGPWVTRESWVSQDQAFRLYRPSVLDVLGAVPVRYSSVCAINNGVFGFNRDDDWLTRWRDLCERFLSSPQLLANCKCRDQTALVTLLAEEHVDVPRIIEDRRFNWPANGLKFNDRSRRKRYEWDEDTLDQLRRDHPEEFVVHWMGKPKPWELVA